MCICDGGSVVVPAVLWDRCNCQLRLSPRDQHPSMVENRQAVLVTDLWSRLKLFTLKWVQTLTMPRGESQLQTDDLFVFHLMMWLTFGILDGYFVAVRMNIQAESMTTCVTIRSFLICLQMFVYNKVSFSSFLSYRALLHPSESCDQWQPQSRLFLWPVAPAKTSATPFQLRPSPPVAAWEV